MSDVGAIFNIVIEDYPEACGRLSVEALIIADSDFEAPIVKLQRIQTVYMTGIERNTVWRLRYEATHGLL